MLCYNYNKLFSFRKFCFFLRLSHLSGQGGCSGKYKKLSLYDKFICFVLVFRKFTKQATSAVIPRYGKCFYFTLYQQ